MTLGSAFLGVRGPGVLNLRVRRWIAGGLGALLLARASHRWDPSTYQGNGPWVDRNGGLPAWKGAAGQAAITDIGLALPGTSGNYASTPHTASLNPSGEIAVQADLRGVTVGASQIFASKFTSAGDQRGWRFGITAAGKLTFQWSTSGVNLLVHTQPGAAFTRRYVSAQFDPSTGTTYFSDSDDLISWTSLGEAGPTGATSVFACTADLVVSGRNDGAADQFGPGVIGSVLVEYDEVPVASPDFANETPGALTHTDAQGNVFTINQSADGSDDPEMEPPAVAHVSLPGVNGNYVQANTPVSVVGDLVVAAVVGPSATTGSFQTLVGCRNGTDGYTLALVATGELRLTWRDSGGTLHNVDSTAAVSAGEHAWGAALDLDDGAGNHVVSFTEDGAALGAAVSNVGATSIKAPTSNLTIGAHPAGTADLMAGGLVKSATVHDGTTLAADLNIARDFDGDHNTVTSTETDEDWTVNRSTAAVGYRTSIVTAPKPRYGGAQNLRFAAPSWLGAAGQDFTIVQPFRSHSQPATSQYLLAYNTGGHQLRILLSSAADRVTAIESDSVGTPTQAVDSVAVHDGKLHVVFLRRTAGSEWALFVDSADNLNLDSDGLGTIDLSADDIFVGSSPTPSSFFNGEDLTPPITYNTALSDDEINALCTQLGAGT